jgi:GDP-L-fucose synthase
MTNYFSGKKIWVTGHRGMLGCSLVRLLCNEDAEIITSSRDELNLLDQNKVLEWMKKNKPDLVVHAAAKVGGIGGNSAYPVEFLTQNIQIQSNLMDAAHSAGVEKLVFLGSSCIYPRSSPQPIKEEFILTGPLEATNSAYAIAKIAGIELVRSYRKEYGHKWISVMPTNLYGPNDNFDLETSHVLPALIRKFVDAKDNGADRVTLWGTGEPLREFLHVDDLAKAINVCLDKYDDDSHINIGSGSEISIKNLAEKVAAYANFQGEIIWDKSRPDGTPRKILDINRILNLGWKPLITMDEGIRNTVEWYQHQR